MQAPRMALSFRAPNHAANVQAMKERQDKMVDSYIQFYEHAKIELKSCSQKLCTFVNEDIGNDELVQLFMKIVRCYVLYFIML
jgi:hypothetical protein